MTDNANPTPVSDAVRHVLCDLAAESGQSLAELAEAAGMSDIQLAAALTGRRPFTVDQLDQLCEALETPVADVVDQAARLAGADDGSVSQQ